MVTSNAVVGSSAMRSRGLQASAHRNHDALTHAARQLMRIFTDAPRRLGNADQRQHLDAAMAGASRRDSPSMQPKRPRRFAGRSSGPELRLVIGSWKIMLISLPRMARISTSDRARRSRSSNRIRPAILPGGSWTSRRIDIDVTDLPQPLSPTIATVSQ